MAPNTHVDTTDRMCEAVMRAVISNGALLMKDLHNYDNWAEIMWAGSVAHNGILGVGRNQSWASHGLEVEASAVYDIPHGQGLAIIIPAWMRTVYQSDPTRFMQFAVRVMDVEMAFNDPDAIILEGIQRLENFFRSIGQPTHFSEIGINDEKFEEMAQVCDAEKGVPYDISIAAYRAAL